MAVKPGAEIEKIEYFIETVGAFGRYHKLYMALMQFEALWGSLFSLFIIFAKMEPRLACHDPGFQNLTDKCDIIFKCANYSMEAKHGFRSLYMDYPDQLLIPKCTSGGVFDPLLSMISVSGIIGGVCVIVIGFVVDLAGRKAMILTGTAIMLAAIFGLALARQLEVFVAMYFTISIGGALRGVSVGALGNECTLSKYRLTISMVSTWAFAYPFAALVAFLTKDYQKMMTIAVCMGILVLVGFGLCAESPRWLLVGRRYKRAATALNWIAWVNGTSSRFTEESLRRELKPLQPKIKHHTNGLKIWLNDMASIKHVLRNKRLGIFLAFIICYMLTTGTVCSNYITNAGEMNANPYMSLALIGLFRIWTPFVVIGLDQYHPKFNRKVFLTGGLLLASIPITAAALFAVIHEEGTKGPDTEWLETAVAMTTMLSVAMLSGLVGYAMGQVIMEVFPTVTRGAAISFMSIFGLVTSALSPHVVLLDQVWKPFQFVLGAVCLWISLVASVYAVPETKNKPLPDRFDDMDLVLKNGKHKILEEQ